MRNASPRIDTAVRLRRCAVAGPKFVSDPMATFRINRLRLNIVSSSPFLDETGLRLSWAHVAKVSRPATIGHILKLDRDPVGIREVKLRSSSFCPTSILHSHDHIRGQRS